MYKRFAGIDKPTKCVSIPCTRCGGKGDYYTFGPCFRCGGMGQDPSAKDWGYPQTWTDAEINAWHNKRIERSRKASETRMAKQQAAAVVKFAENLLKCPELAEIEDYGGILGDLREKAQKYDLSDAQIELVRKLIAEKRKYAIARAAKAETDLIRTHVGSVGEKITFSGSVHVAKSVDTQWNLSRLVVVEDENSNVYKIFTTSAFAWDLGVGDTITITATVKAHDIYDGTKQTVVTRPKLVEHHKSVTA